MPKHHDQLGNPVGNPLMHLNEPVQVMGGSNPMQQLLDNQQGMQQNDQQINPGQNMLLSGASGRGHGS